MRDGVALAWPGWFTEGFDTREDAKALLEELAA
jgi:hypothetical protein